MKSTAYQPPPVETRDLWSDRNARRILFESSQHDWHLVRLHLEKLGQTFLDRVVSRQLRVLAIEVGDLIHRERAVADAFKMPFQDMMTDVQK